MSFIDGAAGEINFKIAYYGPWSAGKTTCIEWSYENEAPIESRSELYHYVNENERILFCHFVPRDQPRWHGHACRFHLYTFRGSVNCESARDLVLHGVDGVVFVCDSYKGRMEANVESLDELESKLARQGKQLAELPHAILYNRRDFPDTSPIESLRARINRHDAPDEPGIATRGQGVKTTLYAVIERVLERQMKIRP